MEISVTIEPIAGQHFLARSGEPFPANVKAPTRDEALRQLREIIETRLKAGIEVVSIEVAAESPHTLASPGIVGDLAGHEILEPWKAAIAAYRVGRDAVEGDL